MVTSYNKDILNIFAIIAVYALYNIFQFNFNTPFVNWSLNFALILVMVGIAIAIIVELISLVMWIFRKYSDDTKDQ